MRETVFKRKPDAGFPRISVGNGLQVRLGLFVSRAEQNEMEILREQMIEDRHQKIETFLNVDARDHRDDRPIKFGIVQAELTEKRALVGAFAFESSCIVVTRNQRIRLRVPRR